ncbi:hypothetical protein FNU76_04175 [Chitinimonas arctica]|uniref:Uncharacterized protein n=1 Tax=Chitinimonas arctica TaxID=2594795 RepID=A0A516SBU2_9NEIS|nr:hypothetical protein [Chitinimonas arctica]QDQ25613.1 hypothetical protein FNU76_04175 [Chitinimonas arctica]
MLQESCGNTGFCSENKNAADAKTNNPYFTVVLLMKHLGDETNQAKDDIRAVLMQLATHLLETAGMNPHEITALKFMLAAKSGSYFNEENNLNKYQAYAFETISNSILRDAGRLALWHKAALSAVPAKNQECAMNPSNPCPIASVTQP